MKSQCSPTHHEVLGKSLNYMLNLLCLWQKKKKDKTKLMLMYLLIPTFSNNLRNSCFKAPHTYTLQKYEKM